MRRVLIVSNTAWNMQRYRMGYLRHLATVGEELHVACGRDAALEAELAKIGAVFHPLAGRSVTSGPITALRFLLKIWWLLFKLRPDVAHFFTLGPGVIGGVVSRIIPFRCRTVISLTGLGEWRRRWADPFGRVLTAVARLAWARAQVVVQNHDDRDLLAAAHVVAPENLHVVLGSGVPVPPSPFPLPDTPGPARFVMVSRMLWSKGVKEFAGAARLVREKIPDAEFYMVGGAAEDYASRNPDFVGRDWLQALNADPAGPRWLGFLPPAEVQEIMRSARAVVLPSTYAEGIPRTLLEALAEGRAVITCDSPGCREVVPSGHLSGFLVPPHDARSLAAACQQLVDAPHLAQQMGQAGHNLATRRFAENIVNRKLAAIYDPGLTAKDESAMIDAT